MTFRTPQCVLFASDIERTAGFYREIGFVEKFRTPTTGVPIHVDLELDGYRIGVASVDSTRDDHGLQPLATGQRFAVVVWTDDVGAELSTLAARGVTVLKGPEPWLGRLRIAWIADPDGNPVQLVQDMPA
jgi:catechol 2,3-dioxygenase-like lactoylglutathione lyase family enzyme